MGGENQEETTEIDMEPAQSLHSHVARYMIHRRRLNCLILSSESRQKFRRSLLQHPSKEIARDLWQVHTFRRVPRGHLFRMFARKFIFVQKIFQFTILPTNQGLSTKYHNPLDPKNGLNKQKHRPDLFELLVNTCNVFLASSFQRLVVDYRRR